MNHTSDVNRNNSLASKEDYKTIIYKYLEARKDSPKRELLRMIFPIFSTRVDKVTPIHELIGHIYLSLAQVQGKTDPAITTFLASSPFQEGILSDDEIQILINNRKEVVDFLCSLSLHSSNIIKRKVANLLPYHMDEVVIDLLSDLPDGSVIYNPYAGINTYAIAAPQFHFIGEESSLPIWVLGQIRLFIHQIDANIYPEKIALKTKYDAAIIDTFSSTRSVGFGIGNIEKQIRLAYKSLNKGGKLILHYSSEILSDTTTSGVALRDLRKWMIKEKCVRSVVLLPYDLNLNEHITHSVQTTLIILEKKVHSSIRMIDASDVYIPLERRTRKINSDELIRLINADSHECPSKIIDVAYDKIGKNTVLLPTFQLLQQCFHQQNLPNLVPLKDLLIPYKNEYIKSEDEDIRFVHTNELSDNIATATNDFSNIEAKECSENGTLLDKDNLLLISFYSNVLKCSIFKRIEGIKVVCSDQIMVVEVHAGISDIEFFVSELFEKYVQEQAKALCSPYRSVTKSPHFLDDILINIPEDANHNAINRTLERKLKAQKKIIQATGLQLEQLQNKELNDFVHTMRVRKHAMTQVLNSIVPAIKVLKLTLEKNGGTLKSTDVIIRVSGTTLEEYLDKMQGQIDRVVSMVNVLTDDTIYGAPSVVSLYKLMEDFKEKLIEDRFTFTILRDTQHYMDFKLSIDPKDFYQMLENIISNAKKYGFVQQDKEYVIQLSAVPYQLNGKDAVLISIMNNGENLAKGMTPEKVFVIGEHAGKGNGIGGWEMKNIVEHYGGTISLVNHTDEESYFKIEYEIVLPIIESYEVSCIMDR